MIFLIEKYIIWILVVNSTCSRFQRVFMMGREQLERNAQVDAVAQFDFFQFFGIFT